MVFIHILILFGAIIIGARLGSIAIGFAGGLGVLLLGIFGVPVTREDIPFDVIGIIMAVIAAIASMQRAGGMDYLVYLSEKALRRNPKQITYVAPVVTYFMTIFAGTGHTAFATLPVISEVAKESKVRPSRPLSVAVVSSQLAICASPISAAVVFMAATLEPLGVGYLTLVGIMLVSTFVAIFPTAWVTNRRGVELEDDPIYQRRMRDNLVAPPKGMSQYTPTRAAKLSVHIFLVAILAVMIYATLISEQLGLVTDPTLPRNEAIMAVMLTAALAIIIACRAPAAEVLNTQVFRSGMSACICVLGVAWLGTTIINYYIDDIQHHAESILGSYPWLLAIILFFAAAFLYSQAATAKALIPAALTIGVSPLTALASFPAVSALFILPTYPTLLAAVEMDDTGSTQIGKAVVNHPFLLPGTMCIAISILIAFGLGSILL
ncbi:MAG: anaerobic C4-dicarboxylate transporter [Corynebacterium sp.]|nr:anaerobic C4-dicarboxylate transporter [Corynebacterium sp.]